MDQFNAGLQDALEKLLDGFIDQGIDRWERVFSEAKPYLGTTQALWAKAEYAQTLHDMQALDRARAVDRDIQEVLENDEDESQFDVGHEDRNGLLQNIIHRWQLSADGDSDAEPPSDSHENSQPKQLQGELLDSPSPGEPSLRRAQSFAVSGRHATLAHETTGTKLVSAALEQNVPSDVLFTGNESHTRCPPQALNLRSEYVSDHPRPQKCQHGAQRWFSQLEATTHNFMYGKGSRFFGKKADGQPYARVKVAVLDNGIAYTKREHKNAWKRYRHGVLGYASFIDGEKATDALDDESGHGTTVAVQVMKTCPTAEIYVGRVVKKNGDTWLVDKDAVEKAIYVAIDEGKWGVDIINMSFGWDYNSHSGVRRAIASAKAKGVLLFASTSNYGLTAPNDILYPAIADEVISVDAADGNGEPAGFNPSSVLELGKERFTAPGIGIPSPMSEDCLDGTSFASPIAAGVAALVLEFAKQSPLANSPSVLECLRERRGMVLILRAMSRQKGFDQFKFLCPWKVLGDEGSWYGGDGQPGTRRYFVAYEIVQRLRGGFGREVGQETFPST